MLNEKKIRLMTELARYEEAQGKNDRRIYKYYRSDYVGLALFRNFFIASIGYVLVLIMLAAYFSEYLLENVHKMNLLLVVIFIVAGYIITIVVYSAVTYAVYSVRYKQAQYSIKAYDRALAELEKFYGSEKPQTEKSKMERPQEKNKRSRRNG